jgi:hypothetical protein
MLTVMHLFLQLAACFGGSSTPGEGDAAQPAPTRPMLQCPIGTTLESGNSAKGNESWCDKDGVMHGPYVRYYPDGARAVKGAYDNNLPDGDWIWWHDNQQEASKGKYVRGKQTGPWTWWHANGNRAEEGDFLQGRKAGQWVSWFDSGSKKDEGMYHNGIKDGLWTYYDNSVENEIVRTERWERGAMAEEHVIKNVPAPPPAPKP